MSQSSTSFLVLIFSGVIGLTASLALTDTQLLWSIIMFGQAHYVIAYVYVYRAGKITSSFRRLFYILIAILSGITTVVFTHQTLFPYLICITGIVFVFHYASDAFRLLGIDTITTYKLVGVVSIVSAFIAVFFPLLFSVSKTFMYGAFMMACVLCILFIIYEKLWCIHDCETQKKIAFLVAFILPNIVGPIMAFHFGARIVEILGCVILFHYLHWYLFYFKKLSESAQRSAYVRLSILINATIFVSFVGYYLSGWMVLAIFFHPIFFYGWTLLHILLTLRPQDYKPI